MSHPQPRQYFAATHRAVANADAIEWEQMPSLMKRLVQRGLPGRGDAVERGANDSRFETTRSFAAPWESTVPAPLDALPASTPFREPLAGLATREVHEPDLFRHFFGPGADAR